MTEKSASPVVAADEKTVTKMETTKKAGGPKAAAKPRVKPNHPSTADMVKTAIKTLAERGGSSLQAVKKYIAATYKIDAEKQAPFIKKYLKAAVVAGTLVQTKGKGASGSFKLAVKKSDTPKSKPKAAGEKKVAKPKKPASPKKAPVKKSDAVKAASKKPSPKKAPAKRAAAGEKRTTAKSTAAAAAGAKIVKSKAPSKAKKVAKAPTAKPKVPKPKKVAPSPKAAKTATKKPAAQKK